MAIGEIFREWDEFDVLAIGGMLVTAGSIAAALFPRFRRLELLVPIGIGAAMMTVAAFGARHSEIVSDPREVIAPPLPDRYPTPA
jgi:hypothetical protein